MQNIVTIKILGREYKVRTIGDDNYLQSLSNYINTSVAHVQRQGTAVSTMELMAVVLLNVADEVHKTRSELEDTKNDIDMRINDMIAKIDNVLRLP